uniref:ELYS-like domain-containing protein n=1 Tax=Oryza punctata TaxID=4537 RepID=A0A0E0KIS1_ORYPU
MEQNALEQLASIDLIELCKEARIEHCRATRDLSSCGRYVQHVLNSCGHASLCAECSQRCDVCPICRSPIPDTGNRVRLRLYHKCLEAGLISKQHDERFQEKDDHGDPVNLDVQRLHSLFDVALQNNLASLICHYTTDVCLDENAVSSDPLLAFLLDEVVIKEWCKKAKFAVQLAGISSVVEVMITSFSEAVSAHVNDLHQLMESTLKAKQHLEAMMWCIRHKFLEDILSRHTNLASWSSDVIKRKASAKERQWPEFSDKSSAYNEANQGILFIEQALQNLGIQESYSDGEEGVEIVCLQSEQSSSMFCSTIDQFSVDKYPFKNLREAVDEACSLLPKISSKETHPKIAQVLLERHKPDVALVVLKCIGRDTFSSAANIEKDDTASLSEAVTAVRVRIEYGHLTEAFMYHRSYCSKVKEQRSADMPHVEDANSYKSSWMYHVEVMMTEFCNICIERNFVDRMIDLPWDSEEGKHLHKSLLDCAREMPMEPCGSLLVVFYLQRYRYLEAYEVDRSLQSFEQNALETASEEEASKIRTIAQWRQNLVTKCVEMLPEAQREDMRTIGSGERNQFAVQTMQNSSPANHMVKSSNPAIAFSLSTTPIPQKKSSPLQSRNINVLNDSVGLNSSARSEFSRKVPSILQCRPVPLSSPISNMRSTAGGLFPSMGKNGEGPYLKGTKELSFTKGESGFKKGTRPAGYDSLPMYFNMGSVDTPMKDYRSSSLKTEVNRTTPFQGKDSVRKGEFDFGSRAEKPFILSGTCAGQNGHSKIAENAGFHEVHIQKTKIPPKENVLRNLQLMKQHLGTVCQGGDPMSLVKTKMIKEQHVR